MRSGQVNCPVAACPGMRSPNQLVCRSCWGRVPRDMQRAVFVEFRSWAGINQTPDFFWLRERILADLEGRLPDPDNVTRLADVFD